MLLSIVLCSAAVPAQQGAVKKGRKQIAAWLVFKEEPGFDRIQRYSGILSSLSIFGDPPREFIDRCHQLNIEVYYGVSGNASAFDSPASAKATLEKYLQACRVKGYDGIDLDFEHLDPALQDKYSGFLRMVSSALHAIKKKLSHCVGFYPGMDQDPPKKIFYDPKVVAETCDLVRVMCYDFYWAPGRGDPKQADRPDTQGIGPTSSFRGQRPRCASGSACAARKADHGTAGIFERLLPFAQGKGAAGLCLQAAGPPATPMEKAWLWYERLPVYLYVERGAPHLFYASDAESTKAHLETVDELDLPGIGFWHFSSIDEETWKAVGEWLKSK